MDNKEKHLEMIQGVINRMANNSFMLKGWSVILVSALFALSAKDAKLHYACLALFPTMMFWILDGYFLWQERMYRALYDAVRLKDKEKIDYSMDATSFEKKVDSWPKTMFSLTLNIFHGSIFLAIVAVVVLVHLFSK